MKILVTGGAGFIGSNTVRMLLDGGHDVNVLDNLSLGHKESVDKRAKFFEGDIADEKVVLEALDGADAVIHMAGLIVVPDSVKDPVTYCENNVLKTISFLEFMKKKNVKKIIFSSSACVYGTPDSLPIKEDALLKPDNPYGASKASVEAYLQAYSVNFGMDVIVLRYFNPFGPGEDHDPETHAIPNFIKNAIAKKPIPLYWNGEQTRDFIYIDDLAQAHIDVLNLKGHQIFNVGSEKGVKVMDAINTIFKILGYKVEIEDLGKRPGDVDANYASSEKIEKEIGWKAKTSLEEGLRKTIEFYKTKSKT